MLWWDVYRVKKSRLLDAVVVAATTDPRDAAIAELCEQQGWSFFRGSEDDVLDRYYQAARRFEATSVVRITSDCPLIDPHVIDYVIAAHLSTQPQPDYSSNTVARTYPRGLDAEIFSMAALERAWQAASEQPEREHVTLHLYRNPQHFRLLAVTNDQDFSAHRWTVDTPEDMELVQRIYGYFGHGDFHWQEVIDLLAVYPEWAQINRGIEQKKV